MNQVAALSTLRFSFPLILWAVLILLCFAGLACDQKSPVSKSGNTPFALDDPSDENKQGVVRPVYGAQRSDSPSGPKACERIPLEPVDLPDITAGPSVVTLDENGFFVVNDTKFFPYGFYGYPSDPTDMTEFADAGFNTAIFHGPCCQGASLSDQIDALAWLGGYGVLGAGHAFAPVSQIYSELEATLQDWLDQRIDTGALLFWYTYDEPGIWSVPKDEAQDYHLLLHDMDADHPNALVQCVNEDFTEYIDYTDFMMVDPYPVPWMPLSQVKYTVLEAAAASGGIKPVFGVAQAFDWYVEWGEAPPDHTWRPHVWELRNMTYQYLVLGVNGILYFAYNRIIEHPDRWTGLKQIAAEVRELTPILLEPDAGIAIAEDPDLPYIDHALREHEGIYYLMVISTWFDDATVSYDLSPLGQDLCVVEYFSGDMLEVSGEGILTLQIDQNAEKVLQIIPS